MIKERKNQEWKAQLDECIEDSIEDARFTAPELARRMGISERQLFRKVKALTSFTPNDYLNNIRFNKAKQYFEDGTYDTVANTAKAVGFKDPGYFSKKFKERFGKLPSEL